MIFTFLSAFFAALGCFCFLAICGACIAAYVTRIDKPKGDHQRNGTTP